MNKISHEEQYDAEMAYGIWIVEKEFNVGPITESYPMLKFWNLLDSENIKRYEKEMDQSMNKGKAGTLR